MIFILSDRSNLPAHRTPNESTEYARGLAGRGIKVLIAGAGWAARLAGVAAAQTTIPVIGVPIDSSPLNGMDALLSTVRMPPGVPVATMVIGSGGAYNAAVFVVRILSLLAPELGRRYASFGNEMADEIISNKNRELKEYFAKRGSK